MLCQTEREEDDTHRIRRNATGTRPIGPGGLLVGSAGAMRVSNVAETNPAFRGGLFPRRPHDP